MVDPVRGRMLVLNDTGLYLWQALELPKNTGELADSLCAEFAVSAETATRDVNVFLESLRERNLLEAAE
ncbi:MAG: PqqD family protein [Chrysiogenetes bacterium]|nr:PqqD family protein [Chrysiogenetes bacterium]